ncbi:MAG TPA: ferredoxin--NADP reductase [Microthrixaceae bacterium]|nr:ferredoxin--NADP reductase [Microthrixaceae bacterium]
MATPAPTARPHGAERDHGFHPLRVARVVDETSDTRSFALEVPDELRAAFAYDAGQFCNFRVVIDGTPHERCYSMSSSPAVDDELCVTVKRVPDGVVSNWMNDELSPGDLIDANVPSGLFRLGDGDGDVVAFGAGSGITPILSIIKSALATTTRRVRLLYANRDRDAIIFAADLETLLAEHPGRLVVEHHLDVERGFVDAGEVGAFADRESTPAEHFICGPTPFMDVVETTLLERGVDAATIRIERFTAADLTPPPDASDEPDGIEVTVELGGRKGSVAHRPGTTLLQVARELGLSPPFSCESGNCATCMARLVEGEATMRTNNALLPEELEEGWVLTCQAVPTSPTVHVIYE